LFDYLTSSSELPESTRRWPAWRHRLVPKIVLAVSDRWLGAGPHPKTPTEAAAEVGAQEPAAAAVRKGAKSQGAAATGMDDGQASGQADIADGGSSKQAKENKRPQNSKTKAAAVAVAAAGPQRSSARERKANSKFSEFLHQAV
jgi:hypothetical protein